MQLSIAVYAVRDGFRAEVRQLPGCVVSARTLRDLARALERAVGLALRDSGTTLLYLELAPGELTASAVPSSLACRPERRP